uniref:Oxysterol-binding protein n=1 Tax=Oryzias sinensis TaxID=183150 RepID=A0A8C8DHW5_9TELE
LLTFSTAVVNAFVLSSPKKACSFLKSSKSDSWEMVEGLSGSLSNAMEPQKQEGYMLKKRKWPMKGWHKRYFFLDKGTLKYGKCRSDIEKGKLHGCIDVGFSVMAIKKKAKCIDLDAEENIYHLKVKTEEMFDEWVSNLRHHRLYRQNVSTIPNEKSFCFPHYPSPNSPTLADAALIRRVRLTSITHKFLCPTDLSVCESYLLELNHMLKNMEVLHRTYSAPSIQALQVSNVSFDFCISQNSVHKRFLGFILFLYPLSDMKPTELCDLQQLPLCSDHLDLCSIMSSLTSERERLRQCLDHETFLPTSPQVVNLKNTLAAVCEGTRKGVIMKRRTMNESVTVNPSVCGAKVLPFPSSHFGLCFCHTQDCMDNSHTLVHQASNESRASVADSISEFFDAQEVLLSASSSENEISEDDSYISDISDTISVDNLSNDLETDRSNSGDGMVVCRRRSCLPAFTPNGGSISMWNILRNNIGKDLSKVAMPVALNEPLNMLQRLCEELEYSELLDRAANTHDPYERMMFIATFVVSGYASSYYRTGGKPFNPILGETFECNWPDKGFRFVAEQVSHHPPISACHAESKNFVFWQDVRCKNKFWGKSLEIVPVGTTHVTLPGFGDHYEWNKVTSCIHNILSGQRRIEHYGEISIKNSNSDICQCKITFIKTSYWSSRVNEVEGTITDNKGKVIHRIFGKWHEAVYCGDPPSAKCIWRANAMPVNHEQYYGFTKFAIELNELDPSLTPLLPPTDTRLRVDQRLLEEGNLEAAEEQKQRIEQLQRDRRKVLEDNKEVHQPKFFSKSKDDTWVSNYTYWELRKDPGFVHIDFPTLW